MDQPEIRDVGGEDRDKAVHALTLAFSGDPLMRWFYPEPADFYEFFPELLRRYAGKAFEHRAAHATEGFSGTALWLPPEVSPDEELVGELVEKSIRKEIRDDMYGLLGQMGEYHPHDAPTWYLPVIGVDPFYQRRGIGGALLRHQLRRCDEAGIQAYLESSNPANIPLYERHGFRVMGRIEVGSSPPVHPMLRPIGG